MLIGIQLKVFYNEVNMNIYFFEFQNYQRLKI